jgi:hypothetical protein
MKPFRICIDMFSFDEVFDNKSMIEYVAFNSFIYLFEQRWFVSIHAIDKRIPFLLDEHLEIVDVFLVVVDEKRAHLISNRGYGILQREIDPCGCIP